MKSYYSLVQIYVFIETLINHSINSNSTEMNKKFIHGLLIVATVAVGMGALSSCKDNQNDTWTEVESQQVALEKKIKDLETQLKALQTEQSNCKSDCASQIQDLKNQIANCASQADLVILQGKVANLEALKDKVTTIETTLSTLEGDVATLKQKLEGHDLDEIESDIAQLQTDLNTVQTDLENLTKKVDAILGRLNKLVTGVLVQATENPVIGSHSAPFNIQSNVVMAFFGSNTTDITEFPTKRTAQEFDGAQVITDADWELLGKNGGSVSTVSIDSSSDYLMHDDEGNAGKIYLTINPNNVDFTGLTATLVNSRDDESGVKLGSLTKSDKLLTFGSSRSSEDNGFYEATATVTPAEIPNVKVNIESGLKSAFKEALTNRTKKDFLTLVSVLYNQLSSYLPANAVKVAWTAEDENGVETNYAVYSQYNIAATAFKPLSYKFLAGTSIRNLPTISPISGLTIDKSKFKFNINLKPFEINGVNVNFTLSDITLNVDSKIAVTVTGTTADGQTVNASGTVDLTNFVASIQNDFNSQISGWNSDMQKAFDDAMNDLVAQIKTQVNSMMDDVTAQINDNISDIIDQITSEIGNNSYISRFNSYITKYNSLATRINNVLSNPNNYLQVMLAYEANDELQFMSTVPGLPSPVTLNGGNTITLVATSYTAELVVPAFYKFVGVSNAWVNGDQSKSAQNGNSGAKSAVTKANSTEYMAEPVDGTQIKIPMQLTSGYTYEIVYSALDFHGVTSTRKFYLSVK